MIRIVLLCTLISGCAVLMVGCGGSGGSGQGTTVINQPQNEDGRS